MIEQLVLVFFIFSSTGWFIELCFRSVYERKPVNPGFHRGPWLPLYGSAGLVIFLVSSSLAGSPLYVRLIFYFVLCTAFEFLAGIFLEVIYHRRYWDYSANRFNIRGLVCPLYSFAWVLISVFVEYFIMPVLMSGLTEIDHRMLVLLDSALLAVFTVDFLFSSGILSRDNYRRLKDIFS